MRHARTVELDLGSLIEVSILLRRADETIRKSLTAPKYIENVPHAVAILSRLATNAISAAEALALCLSHEVERDLIEARIRARIASEAE